VIEYGFPTVAEFTLAADPFVVPAGKLVPGPSGVVKANAVLPKSTKVVSVTCIPVWFVVKVLKNGRSVPIGKVFPVELASMVSVVPGAVSATLEIVVVR
jgi:hypothetical protein